MEITQLQKKLKDFKTTINKVGKDKDDRTKHALNFIYKDLEEEYNSLKDNGPIVIIETHTLRNKWFVYGKISMLNAVSKIDLTEFNLLWNKNKAFYNYIVEGLKK